MSDKPEPSPHHRADIEVSHEGDKVMLKAPAVGVTLTADEAQALASRIFEASALARGTDLAEQDLARVPMQYVRVSADRLEFEVEGHPAEPKIESDTGEPEPTGSTAEVHCWIKDQTQHNAMHIAAGWITDHGWAISEVLEQRSVSRADFAGSEYLQYFEQALTYAEVFLFEIDEDEEPEGTDDAT